MVNNSPDIPEENPLAPLAQPQTSPLHAEGNPAPPSGDALPVVPPVGPPAFPPIVPPPIVPPPIVPPPGVIVPPPEIQHMPTIQGPSGGSKIEAHAAPSTEWSIDRAPGGPLPIVPPASLSNVREDNELHPDWVAGREALLRKELGLDPHAPDSAIQPAWGKMMDSEAAKGPVLEQQDPLRAPGMSPHDQRVYNLVAEHDKRIARAHFGLKPDAPETEIFSRRYAE